MFRKYTMFLIEACATGTVIACVFGKQEEAIYMGLATAFAFLVYIMGKLFDIE